MTNKQKFPSEVIDLPSGGKVYPKESPLSDGKLEIKYMTAREEDILTSQNLIKKGIVIDKLMDSLILTEGVSSDDLVVGDKNAVMVAARILAYGPEYECEISHPSGTGKKTFTFNLADCPFKKLPDDINSNEFEIKLPISKSTITFKLLNGKDEREITEELNQVNKLGTEVSPELTTRLRHVITSVEGDSSTNIITSFVQNLLARDSIFLREEIARVSPDIELEQEVEWEGETVKVGIPMTVQFFWPNTAK